MAEISINSFINTYDYLSKSIRIAIGRAGNVIGGGDWSKDRIIPDLIRSVNSEEPLLIRSPHATRPWQHVIDPLVGYLKLAKELEADDTYHGEAFNFGPYNQESRSVESICKQVKSIIPNVKYHLKPVTNNESNLLQLDCSKAKNKLKYLSLIHI